MFNDRKIYIDDHKSIPFETDLYYNIIIFSHAYIMNEDIMSKKKIP
jgi:hypothetical protein